MGRSVFEGGSKPLHYGSWVGFQSELTGAWRLKPYWGKPNVRNFREGGWKREPWRTRNPLHISKEWMSETLWPTAVHASALPDGNAGEDPGDPLEGRGEQTNVSDEGNVTIPRNRENMSTKHTRISELAKKDKGMKFFSIAHLLTQEALYEAFESLRKDASAGEDGVTYAGYEVDAWENMRKLKDRLQSGQYRAQPLRRVYIPKEDGRQRPALSIK